MRPTNSNATQYNPADPPSDPAQLPRYLREEFAKMKAALDIVADGFAGVVYAAPAKPRNGMERNADGTQWNPGSGAGKYRFNGTAWAKVDADPLAPTYTAYGSYGLAVKPLASSVPASNGDMVFERTSNTSLAIKLKGTDGIVRSVALTLA